MLRKRTGGRRVESDFSVDISRPQQLFLGAREHERNVLPGANGLCHFPPACGWLRPEVKISVKKGPEDAGRRELDESGLKHPSPGFNGT